MDCGRGYHLRYDPPAKDGCCDSCGGRLVQRDDDTEGTIRNRMQVYRQQTAPLEDYYRGEGLLMVVDGMNEIQAVHQSIVSVLQNK